MTPFTEASLPPEAFSYSRYMGPPFNLSKADAKRVVQRFKVERVYLNDTYQVNIEPAEGDNANGFPALVHLSIKRIDKQPIHDWRDLQTIKNLLVGPEHEAVELYPAESRLVDTANQYHLWVLQTDRKRFPFGFRERLVWAPDISNLAGAVQRPLINDIPDETSEGEPA